jgi:hypothetical protein
LKPSSRSKSKIKAKARETAKKVEEKEPAKSPNEATPESTTRQRRKALIGAVGGLLVASLVVGTYLALSGSFGKSDSTEKEVATGPGKPKGSGSSALRSTTTPSRGEIVVHYRDGTSETAKTLAQAMGLASNRTGGEVLLGDGTFRIDNGSTIRVPSFGGLTLRAAEGASPVLEVKLKGLQPMFLVNANLHLQGLKVVVNYESPSEAAVFQAERDLTMEHCTFRATGAAEGSRFLLAEGSRATVIGCLFEGFETAIQVEANPGMIVSLKQSIFLSARTSEEATGQTLKFHSLLGKGRGCQLVVDGCSVRSGTFLIVDDFSPTTPVEVDSTGSAFLVKTLLTFEGELKTPPIGPEATVRWKGKENRYQVNGPAWASFPEAPKDLESWSKRTTETGSKTTKLKLAKEPPDAANPQDCGLIDESDKTVGADPNQVGPK